MTAMHPALGRRAAVTGAAAIALAAPALRPRPVSAAEFSYKFAGDWPADYPLTRRAEAAARRIREESSGRLEISIFPDNQMGGDTEMLSQLRAGALEFMPVPAGVLSTFIPAAAITNVGFVFDDYAEVWPTIDGPLGAAVRQKILASGHHVFENIWDNGFRQLTTGTKPVRGLADVEGLKLRVPVSPLHTSLWQALGASPGAINMSEVYSALQTRVYDGQENALPIIQFFRLYEVQKYIALTSHMWEGYWILANGPAWQRLPPDIQEIVTRNLNASALQGREDIARLSQTLRAQLQSEGMTITTPDRAPFREKLSRVGFYAGWKRKFGDDLWALLEAHTRHLA
jgi:tripartite ATP-independent transporter DctP family solute receptor